MHSAKSDERVFWKQGEIGQCAVEGKLRTRTRQSRESSKRNGTRRVCLGWPFRDRPTGGSGGWGGGGGCDGRGGRVESRRACGTVRRPRRVGTRRALAGPVGCRAADVNVWLEREKTATDRGPPAKTVRRSPTRRARRATWERGVPRTSKLSVRHAARSRRPSTWLPVRATRPEMCERVRGKMTRSTTEGLKD
jgi:hypothetical protein